ncbi:MAG: GNAT family N-acetyltransferase [Proteobacteria bacterium]|nr:GNAT family N-acetyltransferase [Pseudomonadota bacterium]
MSASEAFSVRRSIPSDRNAVERITASSGMFSGEELEVALEVFDDAMNDPGSGYYHMMAEVAGEVRGYACHGPIEMTQSSFDLFWIAVDNESRGHGLGRALLAAAEVEAASMGCRQLYVETAGKEEYLPTQRFYERCGYTQAAFLEDFYAPGDAKVIYVKLLGPAQVRS